MKRYSMYALGIVLAALFVASCASAPPAPEPEPDKVAAPVAPAVPAPDAELKNAESLKGTIDKYDLSFAKPEEYRKANGELEEGRGLIGKDNGVAKKLLDSAAARYQVVMDAGISEGAKARITEMETTKKQALGMKADKAAAADYSLGVRKQAETDKLYADKKYLEAWEASEEAIGAYNRSFETAKSKRAAAETAIRSAETDKSSTSDKLTEVNKEIGGAQ